MPITPQDFLSVRPFEHQLIGRGSIMWRVTSVVDPPLIGLGSIIVEDANPLTPARDKKVMVVSLSETCHLVDAVGAVIPEFDTILARIEEIPPRLLGY